MSIEAYKQNILTVEDFLANCPDMNIHNQETIQTAIYQSASLLNGECAGMIKKVWDYNNSGNVDTTNDLYRTEEELSYLNEAFITQTRYYITQSNSWNQGNQGFGVDGFSSSWGTPVNREILAPSVLTSLQRARVYTFQEFKKGAKINQIIKGEWDIPYITETEANALYVKSYQPLAPDGTVATIRNNSVVFENIPPATSIENATNANNVKDSDNEYKPAYQLNKFSELQTNITDNSSAINSLNGNIETLESNQIQIGNAIQNNHTQISELQEQANTLDTSLNDLQTQLNTINNQLQQLIQALQNWNVGSYKGDWNSTTSYTISDTVTYQNSLYLSLKENNIDNLPTDTSFWFNLGNSINIEGLATVAYVDEIKNGLNESIANLQNDLNTLQGQLDTTNQSLNNVISSVNTLNTEAVKLSGNQTISGLKTFSNGLNITQTGESFKFNPANSNATYFAGYKNTNTRLWYIGKGSTNQDNLKIGCDIGSIDFETTGNNSVNFNKGVNINGSIINQATGVFVSTPRLQLGWGSNIGYITPEDTTNKTLKFSGLSGKGKFDIDLNGTSKIINVSNPVNNNDCANKIYVDNYFKRNRNISLNNASDWTTGNPTFTYTVNDLAFNELFTLFVRRPSGSIASNSIFNVTFNGLVKVEFTYNQISSSLSISYNSTNSTTTINFSLSSSNSSMNVLLKRIL